MIAFLVIFLAVARLCLAHGSHEDHGDIEDWATRHMIGKRDDVSLWSSARSCIGSLLMVESF